MAVFEKFVGQAYAADSLLADAQSSINLFVEGIESGEGQNAAYLRQTPGILLAQTLPTSPIRGIWIGEGRMFVVSGSKLYETFANNTETEIGDVGNDGLPVQIFPNGNQLFVISAGLAWVAVNESTVVQAVYPNRLGEISIDATGLIATWLSGPPFDPIMAFSPIYIDTVLYETSTYVDTTHLNLASAAPTTASVPYGMACTQPGTTSTVAVVPVTAASGAYLDGVFIVAAPNSNQMNNSAIDDGTTWSLLNFANKQSYPDDIAAILADHEELYVFGTTVETEIWQTNAAATAFSLQRVPGNIMQHACVARFSPVSLGEGIAWLGGSSRGWTIAYRATGFVPARVSTHAIEAIWASYGTTADATSFVYVDEGHEFWVITFPTGNATWVYDATAAAWHQRGWWNGTSWDRQRQWCHGYAFGKHYVGDWANGNIYTQSTGIYDDNGTAIHRQRAAPHLNTEHLWSFYDFFELLTDASALTTFTLDWSDDGGVTWHSGLTTTPTGVGAGYGLRAIWRRLGRSRDRVFRVTWSYSGKAAIVNAYLGVTQGN